MASLTPGSAFAVSSHPEPAVHRIQEGHSSIPLPPLVRPSRLVVAARNADERWISETVNLQLGNLPWSASTRRRPAPATGARASSSKAVICPADPDGLAREVMQSLEAWGCLWCGELIAHSPCPLCGHRARPRRRPQEGVR